MTVKPTCSIWRAFWHFGIAANHPFEQGNKRTGWAAAGFFLIRNGITIEIPDTEQLALDMIEVIVGKRRIEYFVTLYAPFSRPIHDR